MHSNCAVIPAAILHNVLCNNNLRFWLVAKVKPSVSLGLGLLLRLQEVCLLNESLVCLFTCTSINYCLCECYIGLKTHSKVICFLTLTLPLIVIVAGNTKDCGMTPPSFSIYNYEIHDLARKNQPCEFKLYLC